MAAGDFGGEGHRYISNLVRKADRDRYLAAILAPHAVRGHLLSLYAFDLEIQSIADRVTEPITGEIRVQWWRDWLNERHEKRQSGHPVADALDAAINARDLTVALLHDYLDTWSGIFQEDVKNQLAMEKRLVGVQLPILSLAIETLAGQPERIAGEVADLASQAGYILLLKGIRDGRGFARYLVWQDMIEQTYNATRKTEAGKKALAALAGLVSGRQTRASAAFNRLPRELRPVFAHLAAYSGLGASGNWRPRNPFSAQWRIWLAILSGHL
jgi:15-cis-phytoene synthase